MNRQQKEQKRKARRKKELDRKARRDTVRQASRRLDVFQPEPVALLQMGCADGYIGRRSTGTLHVMIDDGEVCLQCERVLRAMAEQEPKPWPDARTEQREGNCGHCEDVHRSWRLAEEVEHLGIAFEHREDCVGWFALVGGELRFAASPKMCTDCRSAVQSWPRIKSLVFADEGDVVSEIEGDELIDDRADLWDRENDSFIEWFDEVPEGAWQVGPPFASELRIGREYIASGKRAKLVRLGWDGKDVENGLPAYFPPEVAELAPLDGGALIRERARDVRSAQPN